MAAIRSRASVTLVTLDKVGLVDLFPENFEKIDFFRFLRLRLIELPLFATIGTHWHPFLVILGVIYVSHNALCYLP